MLATAIDFPVAGSRGFIRGSADPVTIVRHNRDGTVLLRRDARSNELRNRDATGNTTLPLTDIAKTEEEASAPLLRKRGASSKTHARLTDPV